MRAEAALRINHDEALGFVRALRRSGINVSTVLGAAGRWDVVIPVCRFPGCELRAHVDADGAAHAYCSPAHAAAAVWGDRPSVPADVGFPVPIPTASQERSVLRCLDWISQQLLARKKRINDGTAPSVAGALYTSLTLRCLLCDQRFHLGDVMVKCFVDPAPKGLWIHVKCAEGVGGRHNKPLVWSLCQ